MIDETWCENSGFRGSTQAVTTAIIKNHEIPDHYPGIELDVMQIKPYHLHGIIVVRKVGTAPRGRPNLGIENGRKTQVGLRIASPLRRNGFTIPGNGRAQGPSPTTLSDVMDRGP